MCKIKAHDIIITITNEENLVATSPRLFFKNTANIRIDPAKTSDIATIDAKVPLNPKYFIRFSGGNGNLLAP